VGDQAFLELQSLAGSLAGAVPPQDQDLPELDVIGIESPIPLLVAVYGRFGSADEVDATLARNRGVRTPDLLPRGTELEVLLA